MNFPTEGASPDPTENLQNLAESIQLPPRLMRYAGADCSFHSHTLP